MKIQIHELAAIEFDDAVNILLSPIYTESRGTGNQGWYKARFASSFEVRSDVANHHH